MTSSTVRKATAPKFPPLGPTDRALMRALLEAVDAIDAQTTRLEVIRMLEANDIQGAIDVIRWDIGEAFLQRELPSILRGAYELAGNSAEASFNRTLRANLAFDITNPRAVGYVRSRAGDLIREWGDSSKLGLRSMIAAAFENGVTPQKLARQIMDSGIGLTERYAVAVERYRSRLEDDEETDRSDAQVGRMTERYAQRLLRVRSETVARTEILAASNQGQQELWRQAREGGLIGAEAVQEWLATNDSRVDDECLDLDGETAPLGGYFPGGVTGPPIHPGCRCSLRLLPDGA